jgi:hypothetical protein
MPIESIDLSARLIFGGCALGLMGIIVAFIRGHAIKEKYALLWLPLGLGFLATSIFPELLLRVAERVHLHYITVVVLGVILVFTTILLYFTARLSQMREDLKSLAQELALSRAGKPSPHGTTGIAPASGGWMPAAPNKAPATEPETGSRN